MTALEFLRFVVGSLVVHTDAVEILEKHDELGILLSIKVHPDDIGSLIGRSGKTIDSMRTLLRVFGSKSSERINLRIIEDPIV